VIRISFIALVIMLTGCFDSLLGSPCKPGYTTRDGVCVVDHATMPPDSHDPVGPDGPAPPDGGGPDSGPLVDAGPDATPDAPTCTADTQVDPLNCGVCGHVCASGICAVGLCVGDPRGHVVAIGHDYASANAPMVRVLGNAAALGEHQDLAIARWSTPSAAVTSALASGLTMVGRTSHAVAMPTMPSATAFDGIDVILIDPHTADGASEVATGLAWRPAFAAFLLRGGVVIVLEGAGGTNHQLADGADLFHTTTPIVVTGSHLAVVAGADAVAQQVLSPYFAASTTVAFPTLTPVVSSPSGAVVFHEARP
jgi:hypothetical protein